MKWVLCIFAVLFPQIVTAEISDSQAALIQDLIANASNENDEARHWIEIDGCTVTTMRVLKQEDGSWELWSSFKFEMQDVAIPMDPETGDPRLSFTTSGADGTVNELGIVQFNMKKDRPARFEKNLKRRTNPEVKLTPSPRNGGTTHSYQDSDRWFWMHFGPGSAVKAETFSKLFGFYVQQYCTFLG